MSARRALSWKSLASWLLGYPEAALADAARALKVARETGHSATLMYVLNWSIWTHIHCGNYSAASVLIDEYIPLKDQIGPMFWGGWGTMQRGCVLALTGKASDAVQTITSGIAAMRSTETTMWMPVWLSYLARAKAEVGQFDLVGRCIGEAMTAVETAKERWYEAEVSRIAGEIALLSPEPDVAKAEAYFARALEVAQKQQAKSWELRAAMSMARTLARSGQAAAGPQASRSSPWLVHPRLRHARPEAGQEIARRTGAMRALVFCKGTRAPACWRSLRRSRSLP